MLAEEGSPLGGMSKKKKTTLYAVGGGVLLFAGYAIWKGRSASSSGSSNLIASPSGQIPVFGGTSTGGETLFLPGSQGGVGATQIGESGATTPQPSVATSLGFTNPNTPVQLVGGSLIDTGTGRVAYYGPNGQPGSASNFSGATSYKDISGKTVYYNPNNYSYADTTRAPDTPPLHALAG